MPAVRRRPLQRPVQRRGAAANTARRPDGRPSNALFRGRRAHQPPHGLLGVRGIRGGRRATRLIKRATREAAARRKPRSIRMRGARPASVRVVQHARSVPHGRHGRDRGPRTAWASRRCWERLRRAAEPHRRRSTCAADKREFAREDRRHGCASMPALADRGRPPSPRGHRRRRRLRARVRGLARRRSSSPTASRRRGGTTVHRGACRIPAHDVSALPRTRTWWPRSAR